MTVDTREAEIRMDERFKCGEEAARLRLALQHAERTIMRFNAQQLSWNETWTDMREERELIRKALASNQ